MTNARPEANTIAMNKALILLGLALAVGCGRGQGNSSTPTSGPVTNSEKSALETAVDGFTGKAAIDAGQRAKKRIQELGRKEQQQLDAALDK